MNSSLRRRLTAWMIAGIAGGVVLLGTAAPAAAHNYLVSSTPESGSTLTALPDRFSVTTDDALLDVSGEAAGFALQVRDSAGLYYGDGCLTVSGATLSTAAALGEPGEYTIGWQVVSADGHSIDGEFAFTWDPAADFAPATGSGEPPTCGGGAEEHDPAVAPDEPEAPGAAGVNDLLWLLGTVVVVGVVLFGTLMLLARRRATGPPKR